MLNAQSFGVSMSYLYPKNGHFSSPIAPLSFQDMGVGIGKYFSLAFSMTLYNVGGMSMGGELPLGGIPCLLSETDKPLMGPFVSLAIGVYPIIKIPLSQDKIVLELKGGWLGFKNFNPKLMKGNMNDVIAGHAILSNVDSDWTFDNKFGSGWSYGGDLIFFVTETIGLKLGGKYLLAQAPLNLNGSFSGLDVNNNVVSGSVDETDAFLDFQGLSVNIGVVIKNK
jgi:hypothetical protein